MENGGAQALPCPEVPDHSDLSPLACTIFFGVYVEQEFDNIVQSGIRFNVV